MAGRLQQPSDSSSDSGLKITQGRWQNTLPFHVSLAVHRKGMSNQVLIFSIASIGLLGLALSLHLILYGGTSIPAKMLGFYTFLLTVASLEPLKEYLNKGFYFAEVVVAVGSLMIGPMLFLYCKYRLGNKIQWIKSDTLHFLPAALLLVPMMAGPAPTSGEDRTADIVLYLSFIFQIFAYTLTSFLLVWKMKFRDTIDSSIQQFHLNFVFGLVISSLILFVYSFCSTLLGFNDSLNFKIFIQAFLSLIIFVIVFLNAEALEDHEMSDHRKKSRIQK
jgi:hypothetical protein